MFKIHISDLYLEFINEIKLSHLDLIGYGFENNKENREKISLNKFQLLDYKDDKFLIETMNNLYMLELTNIKIKNVSSNKFDVNKTIITNETGIVKANIIDNLICVFTLKSVFYINLSELSNNNNIINDNISKTLIFKREKSLEPSYLSNDCGHGYCTGDLIYYIVNETSFNSYDLKTNKSGSKITFKPKRSPTQFK